MTEEGLELVRRSAEETEKSSLDPTDVFRLITTWSLTSDRLFYYNTTIVTFGDVWKLVEALLEQAGRWGESRESYLWMSAACLVDSSLAWDAPSSLDDDQGARLWRWESNPPIIWQQPGYKVPSPVHIRSHTVAQCHETMRRLTLPYNLQ